MGNWQKKVLLAATAIMLPAAVFWPGSVSAQLVKGGEPDYDLKLLGKYVFFDEISVPGKKQACASCHEPKDGWTLPNSKINATIVVAPGAAPHALGNIKPPESAYASLFPVFQAGNFGPFVPGYRGGNFWDGRAEGCGKIGQPCPVGDGAVSESITADDLKLPPGKAGYARYLGPTADQALNPFPNAVEQNIREKSVCQRVKTAKYKDLYVQAFGESIDCSPNPKSSPAYRTSYKRIATALAAYQFSKDVNSFTSKRENVLAGNGTFEDQEQRGRDLFYGKARCSVCHDNGAGKDGRFNTYSDSLYHHLGLPYNSQIPGVAKGAKPGLTDHVTEVAAGHFKTPPLVNIDKREKPGFVKAYMHNGYFKSLKRLVHFYNTRDVLDPCDFDATDKQAETLNCWPKPEFNNATVAVGVVGNLQLSDDEEEDVVAYLKTLTDEFTAEAPK